MGEFDCQGKNKDAKFDVTFYNAFNPYLILGNKKKAEVLTRKPLLKTEKPEDVFQNMHDLKLTYVCARNEWEVVSSVNSTL